MIGRNAAWSLLGIVLALGAVTGVANAGCTNPVSGTVTCTGGAGSQVIDTEVNNPNAATSPTVAAQTGFGTAIDVTGGGAAVKTVSITLNGYSSVVDYSGNNNYDGSSEIGLLLVSPSGRNLELLRAVGDPGTAQSDMTVKLADGATQVPSADSGTPWTASGTYAPASYNQYTMDYGSVISGFNDASVNYPASWGSSTLNSVNGVFNGDSVNGNWKLYLVSNAVGESNVQFSSWSITITYTAATTPSTTALSPSVTTAFTSGAGSSVTLTATVTSGATGTVLFQSGASDLGCSQGNPVALSGGIAHCTTTFSGQGDQSLSASYSGDSTYVGSSGTATIFTYNHATSTGTTYCNSGTISSPGNADVLPYPSVIDVGDGENTSLAGESVDTVSVKLNGYSTSDPDGVHMLLVSPDGGHALEFWGNTGGGSSISGDTFTIQDGSPIIPDGAISSGTYGPTSEFNYLLFGLSTPIGSPAPQPPGSYSLAAPAGSATFLTSFTGATANGKWLLFVDSEGYPDTISATTVSLSGWCIDISPASGKATTVSVQSNPTQATKGSSVQFTATVGGGVGNTGQVTFTENGSPLTGAPNGGVANVSSGSATISTSSLPEGDHTITASYHDSTGTYNDSFGTVTMRVDAATGTPTLNGSTWSYCNTAGIAIPAGTVFTNDIGPAAPNPSNIFVTNLPGTINTASLTLNGFHLLDGGEYIESLLVGANGASLDFFSLVGNNVGFSAQNTRFADAYSPVSCSNGGGNLDLGTTTIGPTSCGATSYTTSPFYTLPAIEYATPHGSSTFASVYDNSNGNGRWSLYFDQTNHNTGEGASSWCMNFTENPVAVTAATESTDSFTQGQQGATFTLNITNNGT
ncbi:MAG: Ig-like domain-containing protein, partial [Bryobacteraceae bacterium]